MKKQVLIADDDQDLLDLLTRHCEQLGLQAETANNAMTALGKAEEMIPDAILLDVNMPLGSGLSVCEMMAHHDELKSIPVLVMTGSGKQETVRRCHEMCAYYIPKCPQLWSRIEPVLRDVLDLPEAPVESASPDASTAGVDDEDGGDFGERLLEDVFAVLGAERGSLAETAPPCVYEADPAGPWVLVIEDDHDAALALKLRLRSFGVNVMQASAGKDGYRCAFTESPLAIILDYELPEGNGDYVLRRLKETPATEDIPVIMLTGRREAYVERQVRGLGANEFLTKPLDWSQLKETLMQYLPVGSATV